MGVVDQDVVFLREHETIALEMFERIGSADGVVRARQALVLVHFLRGEYAEARALEVLNLAEFERVGSRLRVSDSLMLLAVAAIFSDDLDAGRDYLIRSVRLTSGVLTDQIAGLVASSHLALRAGPTGGRGTHRRGGRGRDGGDGRHQRGARDPPRPGPGRPRPGPARRRGRGATRRGPGDVLRGRAGPRPGRRRPGIERPAARPRRVERPAGRRADSRLAAVAAPDGAGTGVTNPRPTIRAPRPIRTISRLLPGSVGVVVPRVSVGGADGLSVSAAGMTGTKTSETSSSGSVWSEWMVATLVSGWDSSLAPVRTSAL